MRRPISVILRAAAGRLVILAALTGGAIGFGAARLTERPDAPAPDAVSAVAGGKPLYWYDPMVPAQHFDKPGKSPFMDMQLVPRYADKAEAGTGGGPPGIHVDAAASQALGLRTATARRGMLTAGLTVTGTIAFDQRNVAVVQARSGGFVQRVYAMAPGDVIGAGAPLADILVPDWAGAQAEYLAVRRTGNAGLIQAARQRLVLLGMPGSMIMAVERTGQPHIAATIAAPEGGVLKMLGVRMGMVLAQGQTLAEINGFGTVWLNAAVPEASVESLKPGQPVRAVLGSFPGEIFPGRVSAILPDMQADSRTLTVRIELPNPDGHLRPGMFASVSFSGSDGPEALLVPSEALIRTGTRTLVMLVLDKGRYQPAEVRTGREAGDETEILAGLSEGETIAASGQFLIDSEASLSGVAARPIGSAGVSSSFAAAAKPSSMLYETTGQIEALTPDSVTLSHEPVPAIGWPAMTMRFTVPDLAIMRGLKAGDRVRFSFDQQPAGPAIRRMMKVGR